MTKLLYTFSLLLTFVLGFSSTEAAMSPLAASIFPPVQFPPSGFNITGARASVLWGRHLTVRGIDVGVLGNITDQAFAGIGVSGLVNYNRGTANVVFLQAAGIANINVNKASVVGLQLAGIANSNVAESSVLGVQIALANLSSHTHIMGFQLGAYNQARTVSGFQIGIINQTDILHGIQIGLLNFHRQGAFAVSPIINIGF
jgi:hypothetical protein